MVPVLKSAVAVLSFVIINKVKNTADKFKAYIFIDHLKSSNTNTWNKFGTWVTDIGLIVQPYHHIKVI